MSHFSYYPEILFEETNVVGNVYFANYVRWQNECYLEWLRATKVGVFESVFRGDKRLFASDLSMEFLAPVGATIGDIVAVSMTVKPGDGIWQNADFEIRRSEARQSENGGASLATGHQKFAIVSEVCNESSLSSSASTPGIAYLLDYPVQIDFCGPDLHVNAISLIRLQGKCRERFLADHAPSALYAVAKGKLALHTSTVSLRFFTDPAVSPSDRLQLEMRLTDLRGWGRMTVRFDYFLVTGRGESLARHRFAMGIQSLCCKHVTETGLRPAAFPCEILRALRAFTDSPEMAGKIDEHLDFQYSQKMSIGSFDFKEKSFG